MTDQKRKNVGHEIKVKVTYKTLKYNGCVF